MSEPNLTTEQQIEAQYNEWFDRLQALADTAAVPIKLDRDDGGWFGRWFDYYTPEGALAAGPERD